MKSYVISVSLGSGCYRHIRIGEQETLDTLHEEILDAFDFEDGHAHAFFMDDRYWSSARAYCSHNLDGTTRLSREVTLRQLQLEEGEKFKFLFDFGDEWRFQCKVLRELEERTDIPGVTRSMGAAPKQYPDLDEDDDFEDDEDEDEDDDYEGNGSYDVWTPLTEQQREELYKSLPVKRERVDEIRMYLNAAASLYGLLVIEELLRLYNSQNPPMTESTFMEVLRAIHKDHRDGDIFMIGDIPDVRFDVRHVARCCQVVNRDLLYDDPEQAMRKLARQQKGKPMKLLPKTEFLWYADETYFPWSPQKDAMVKYLCEAAELPQEEAEDRCAELQRLIAQDCPLKSVLEYYRDLQITDAKNWSNGEFGQLFVALGNNTLKYSNRGYTKAEWKKLSAKGKKKH